MLRQEAVLNLKAIQGFLRQTRDKPMKNPLILEKACGDCTSVEHYMKVLLSNFNFMSSNFNWSPC